MYPWKLKSGSTTTVQESAMKIAVNEEEMIDGVYTKGRENEVRSRWRKLMGVIIVLSEL